MSNTQSSLSQYSYHLSVLGLIVFMGLFFQVAWQYPVVDSFPLIERLLNPGFLTNDFYTNTFDAFSPRLILASCIAWISGTFDIHYTLVVGYLNILRIWLYAIGLYLFFKQLVNRDAALVAFAFAALSFLSVPFLPAWWPVTFDFTASNIALMFSMFAWVLVLRKQVAYALLLLCLSVLFHPLVGVHSVLIAVILFLAYHPMNDFVALFKQPKVYAAGIVFSIVFFALYLSFEKVLSADRFVEINGHYRHAHHFILSHMDLEKWLSTFLMLSSTVFLLFKLDIAQPLKRTVLVFFAYAISLTLLGFVFIELIPTRFMVSFIPMRAFPIIVPLMVLVWALFAYDLFKKGNYLGFLVLFLPFLPYHQVGLTWFIFPDSHKLTLSLVMLVLAFVFALASNQFTFLTFGINSLLSKMGNKLSFIQKPSGYILPITVLALLLALVKFELVIPTTHNDVAIYQWLKENTDNNEVVLTELDAASNQKIRLLSNRAVVISKDFPFNEKFYEQWYERYQAVYVERDLARGHIDQQTAEQLAKTMAKYESTILIRTQTLSTNPYFTLIGESQGETATAYIYRSNPLEQTP